MGFPVKVHEIVDSEVSELTAEEGAEEQPFDGTRLDDTGPSTALLHNIPSTNLKQYNIATPVDMIPPRSQLKFSNRDKANSPDPRTSAAPPFKAHKAKKGKSTKNSVNNSELKM